MCTLSYYLKNPHVFIVTRSELAIKIVEHKAGHFQLLNFKNKFVWRFCSIDIDVSIYTKDIQNKIVGSG